MRSLTHELVHAVDSALGDVSLEVEPADLPAWVGVDYRDEDEEQYWSRHDEVFARAMEQTVAAFHLEPVGVARYRELRDSPGYWDVDGRDWMGVVFEILRPAVREALPAVTELGSLGVGDDQER